MVCLEQNALAGGVLMRDMEKSEYWIKRQECCSERLVAEVGFNVFVNFVNHLQHFIVVLF